MPSDYVVHFSGDANETRLSKASIMSKDDLVRTGRSGRPAIAADSACRAAIRATSIDASCPDSVAAIDGGKVTHPVLHSRRNKLRWREENNSIQKANWSKFRAPAVAQEHLDGCRHSSPRQLDVIKPPDDTSGSLDTRVRGVRAPRRSSRVHSGSSGMTCSPPSNIAPSAENCEAMSQFSFLQAEFIARLCPCPTG